jgi:hypothetical protein
MMMLGGGFINPGLGIRGDQGCQYMGCAVAVARGAAKAPSSKDEARNLPVVVFISRLLSYFVHEEFRAFAARRVCARQPDLTMARELRSDHCRALEMRNGLMS